MLFMQVPEKVFLMSIKLMEQEYGKPQTKAQLGTITSTAYNKQMQNITRIIVDPSNDNIALVSATAGI